MRVLIDENVPHDFARELSGHEVATVQGLAWSSVSNGELLRRAAGRFDALITMDSNLEHQQAVRRLPLGVVVLQAKSNRMVHLRPLIRGVQAALETLRPGQVRHVGALARQKSRLRRQKPL